MKPELQYIENIEENLRRLKEYLKLREEVV